MQFTLKTAMKRLVESSNAYGQNDLRESINFAIQSLAGMAGWECLRKLLRFVSAGPRFALPQGCGGIVRACVNGTPASVRMQDFRFIHSGPGEKWRVPRGFTPLCADNVVDLGTKPVMQEPHAPFRVFGMTTPMANVLVPASGQNPPTVTRLSMNAVETTGRIVSFDVPLYQEPVRDASGELSEGTHEPDDPEVVPADMVLSNILTVSLTDAENYITLFAEDVMSGHRWPIAVYNPFVEAPEFRHYEIQHGGLCTPPGPIELLVECRIDPLPLVRETDVVPFSSLNPIEWVLRGDWLMKSGETDAAQKYYGMASSWLRAQEVTNDTVQTQLVVNSVMANSMAEISTESVNI